MPTFVVAGLISAGVATGAAALITGFASMAAALGFFTNVFLTTVVIGGSSPKFPGRCL